MDLLKIRGTIANGNQKIKEELLKRNHLSKEERIERLEIELECPAEGAQIDDVDQNPREDIACWHGD